MRRFKRQLARLPTLRGLDKSSSKKDFKTCSSPTAEAAAKSSAGSGNAGKDPSLDPLVDDTHTIDPPTIPKTHLLFEVQAGHATAGIKGLAVSKGTAPNQDFAMVLGAVEACSVWTTEQLQDFAQLSEAEVPQKIFQRPLGLATPKTPKTPPRWRMQGAKQIKIDPFASPMSSVTSSIAMEQEHQMGLLTYRPHTHPGLAGLQGFGKSPSTAGLKEPTLDFDKVLRAQEQLSGLLDSLEDAPESATDKFLREVVPREHKQSIGISGASESFASEGFASSRDDMDHKPYRVSEESMIDFRCFMQGYARRAQNSKHTLQAVDAVIGAVEVDRSYSPSTRDIGDHYAYFTQIPRDDCDLRSSDNHAIRLEHVRSQLARDRAIMNSRKSSKTPRQKEKERMSAKLQPNLAEVGMDSAGLSSTLNFTGSLPTSLLVRPALAAPRMDGQAKDSVSECATPHGRSRRGTICGRSGPGTPTVFSNSDDEDQTIPDPMDSLPAASPFKRRGTVRGAELYGGQAAGSRRGSAEPAGRRGSAERRGSDRTPRSRHGSTQMSPRHVSTQMTPRHGSTQMTPRHGSSGNMSVAVLMNGEPSKESERASPKAKGKAKSTGKLDKKDEAMNIRISATSAVATAALKAEMRKREACESLRFLVFGTDGTFSRGREGGAFYEQRCGTQEEIMQLHSMWNQMDEDGSGDVEFEEFLSFFSRSKADRLLGMRCVKYLVGNLKDQDDEDEPDGCRIEDMMKLIWLKATQDDIKHMLIWFRQAEFTCDRAQSPPLLPKRKRREVLENFPTIDRDGKDITFEDLVDTGLVDASTAKDLRLHFDRHNMNRINEPLLLEMLCPNGYRAHRGVRTCCDTEGQPLIYVSSGLYTGWVPASKAFKWDIEAAKQRDSTGFRGSTIFDNV